MREIGSIYVGDGPKPMGGGIEAMAYAGLAPVVVTDPPFNVGYHYNGYSDRMCEGEHHAMLAEVTAQTAAVVTRQATRGITRLAPTSTETETKAAAYRAQAARTAALELPCATSHHASVS